jgi:prevent-host-death family protein
MGTVSASDANRSFSALLRRVNQGESVTVLSRGRPVATISPAQQLACSRSAARQVLFARLEAAPVMASPVDWRRDDLYD